MQHAASAVAAATVAAFAWSLATPGNLSLRCRVAIYKCEINMEPDDALSRPPNDVVDFADEF